MKEKLQPENVVKLRSIGLSDADVEKLNYLRSLEGVSSKSEMIRRLIYAMWRDYQMKEKNKWQHEVVRLLLKK